MEDLITQVLREMLGPSSAVRMEDRLREDLNLHSLDFVDLIDRLERRLGRRINYLEFFEEVRDRSGAEGLRVSDLVILVRKGTGGGDR